MNHHAHSRGTWGSAFTADEFAAVRSAGFEVVGQVFGAAVYAADSAVTASCQGTASSASGPEPFAPLVRAMYQARQAAIDRMVTECVQLGGHGVVGVRLAKGRILSLGGPQFTAIGTAVRVRAASALYRRCIRAGFRQADHGRLGPRGDRAGHLHRVAAR